MRYARSVPILAVFLLGAGSVRAQECPSTHSVQLYKVQKLGWYSRNGVDIAASTFDQNNYVVVRSLGTVPFTLVPERNLYYFQHATTDHSQISQGTVNEEGLPVNRTPRIDNWNFLGILGGWSVAWNALFPGVGTPNIPKVQFRNFDEDMNPATDQISLFQFGDYTMYDALDVAAIPGFGKSVAIGMMQSLPGYGVWPIQLQYIEADGTLPDPITLPMYSTTGDRFPVVASALATDDAYVVAAWVSPDTGNFHLQTFDSSGNAISSVITGSSAREIEVAAVPGGFAVVRIQQTNSTTRTVWLDTYNWNGTLIYQRSLASGSNIVNPAISSAMYPVNGQLQPFFAVTFTKYWVESGVGKTGRYLGMTRGLTSSGAVVMPFSSISTASGYPFYEPTVTTEYRNAVKLFTGCTNKLVAGVFWNQNVTVGSDTYLSTYKAFVGVTGVSNPPPAFRQSKPAPSFTFVNQVDDEALTELDSPADRQAFRSSVKMQPGPSQFKSTTMFDRRLNEPARGVSGCYDYLVGSCVNE